MTCMLYIFVHFLAINFLLKLGVFILFTGEKPWPGSLQIGKDRIYRLWFVTLGQTYIPR